MRETVGHGDSLSATVERVREGDCVARGYGYGYGYGSGEGPLVGEVYVLPIDPYGGGGD